MSVTLAQVRTQISDRPQLWPPAAQPPELLGFGDGVNTIFTMRYENYISGTLVVYSAAQPTGNSGNPVTWTAVNPDDYTVGAPGGASTVATNAVITYNTPPAVGTQVGARSQVTAFSDDDLNGFLTRAQQNYTDDTSVLKRVQFDIIDVLLMDREKLMLIAQGDYREDLSAFVAALRELSAKLEKDLQGGPVAGAAVPAMIIGAAFPRPYQPYK